MRSSFIKQIKSKWVRNTTTMYTKNHPITPKEVENVLGGFLGVEKDYTEQKSASPINKKKNQELDSKRVQRVILRKE